MKKKMLALLLVVAMLATCLMACGGDKAPADDAAAKSQLVVQIGSDPETIDPALNSASDGGNMILHLFEGLLTVSQDEKLQPGCADLPEVSEDGLTWTFKLKEGLKWSDGSDLTAEDFVYSWKRVCDPAVAAPYGETVLGMVKGFKEGPDALAVTAVDATTLVVELANPCTYFGDLAAFATLSPVQKATIEANGDAWATAAETYVSNGPVMITEWVPGSHIITSKNPNYREADKVKQILNYSIGYIRRKNPFLHSCILSRCRYFIENLIDEDTLYCNTDSLVTRKPRADLEHLVGDEIGQFRVQHKGSFAYTVSGYQWNNDLPSVRGKSKKWFENAYPNGFDILNDELPYIESNTYYYDKEKGEIKKCQE